MIPSANPNPNRLRKPKFKPETIIPKMLRSLLKPLPLFLLSLSLLALYFLSSLYNPSPNPNLSLSRIPTRIPKIYMYDLPKKFTNGVIENYAMARESSEVKYPGHQHLAEWYLYGDLNRAGVRVGSVERVLDPEEADLFYVPFFSSLSLIVNPIRPDGRAKEMAYSDEEMQGGKIRDTLFQILEHEDDVIIKHGAQSRVSRRMASQGMHSSQFCLHPAGDTPSACRLFDAIVSLCVPVIVSDYIELPFEDVVDYKKIAVFVHTNTAVRPGYLASLLRRMSTETILQYQRELKQVRIYFEYDDPNGTVNEIWRQVSSKLPLIKLMINRDKRLLGRSLDDPDCSCICSRQNGTTTR